MADETIDWQERIGFQRVVRRGPLVVVSGTGPLGEDGKVGAHGDPYGQTHLCLERIRKSLSTVGAEISQVISTRILLADVSHWQEVGRAHGEVFQQIKPTTMMSGGSLLDPHFLVEIEAMAWAPEA